ncbi:unnamed protein product [Auanema sp. JU1783]|nr:unnamed protein product [Auanema sp. JU1783]
MSSRPLALCLCLAALVLIVSAQFHEEHRSDLSFQQQALYDEPYLDDEFMAYKRAYSFHPSRGKRMLLKTEQDKRYGYFPSRGRRSA